MPAYTQSTQLRTLIFECPKDKNVLNREKCNKTCLTRVRSLHYKYTDFVIILNQSNRILTVFHFCFGNNLVGVLVQKMQEKPPFSSYFDFFS